jgi:class 3 adenylate cyclase
VEERKLATVLFADLVGSTYRRRFNTDPLTPVKS